MAEVIQFAQFQVEQDAEGRPIELGRGGMGVTYKAFDTRLRRPVVLKVIRDGLLNDDTASKRFLREARSAARIQHPNIATVFDQGQEANTFFYAMEFIEGETLQSLIKRETTLAPRIALEIILQVTKALQAAWAEKVIHRDIKPANIMLARDKHGGDDIHVKLIDFGLAKGAVSNTPGEADGGITVTADGGLTAGFVGTPHFASPEQIEPTGEIDIRSDIYSLGVTLWYALHGSPPFGGSSFVRVAAQHLSKPPPFSDLKDAPPPVIALLKRMLAKDREDRPNDPTELRREIEGAIRAIDSGAIPTLAVGATIIGQAVAASHPSGGPASSVPGAPPNLPPPPAARPQWPPMPGSVLAGRYQIFESLGEDVTGKLYKAGDLQQGNIAVALRTVRSGLLETPAALEAFQRGAQMIAQLNHPGLIGGVSLQQAEGGRFATMEWLESRTLLDLLRARGGSIPPAEVSELISQAAAACEAAAGVGLEGLDLALGQVSIHLPGGPPPQGWPALLTLPLAQWPRWQVKLDALEFSETGAPPPMPCPDAGMMTIVPGQVSLKDLGKPLGQRYVERLGALAYELLGGAPHRLDPDRLAAGGYTSVSAVGEEGNAVLKRALRPGPMESIVSPAQFAGAFAAAIPKARVSAPAQPPAYATTPPAAQLPAYVPPTAPPPAQVPVYHAPQAPPPAQPPQPPPQFVFAPPAQQAAPTPPPAKSNLGMLVGIGAGVVVLGGVALFALKPGKKTVDPVVNATPTPSSSVLADIPTPTPEKPIARPSSMSAEDKRATDGMSDRATAAYLAVRKSETDPARAWLRVAETDRLGSNSLGYYAAASRAVQLDANSAPAHEAAAYAALVLAKFDDAERLALKATLIDSRSASGWRTLGVCSYLKFKFNEANEQFGRAVSVTSAAPASAANYAIWADALVYQSRLNAPEEAKRLVTQGVELMQRATSEYRNDVDCWRSLGRFLSDAGQQDRAQEAFERALKINADYVETLNDRANAYSTAKQYARAVDTYQRALKVNPEYPIVWSNMGGALALMKEYPRAIEAYQRALKGTRNFPFALEGLADAYIKNGQAGLAVEPAKNATVALPIFAQGWKTLSDAYRRTNEYPKAIEAGQKAVELAPGYAEAHEMLGAGFAASGQLDKALLSYQKAIEIDPNSGSTLNRLGVVYYRMKQPEKALESYKRATQVDPEAFEAWNNIGDYYKERKQLQLAMENYQKAVRINPKFAVGWNDLGFVLNDLNQDAAALDAYNKAVALNPNYAMAWNNIGYSYNKVGPQEKAVDPLERATRIDPNYAVAWNNLGYAYNKLGRTNEAIAAYEKAVTLRPQMTAAWNDLAQLYDKAGRPDKARDARARAGGTAGSGTVPVPTPKPKGKNEFEDMLKSLEGMGDRVK